MGKLEKYVFGEAGAINLVSGLIFIFVALGLILWAWGYVSGMASGEEYISMKREGVASLFYAMLGILILGVFGGYEIGRYVQTQFTKMRKERLKSA